MPLSQVPYRPCRLAATDPRIKSPVLLAAQLAALHGLGPVGAVGIASALLVQTTFLPRCCWSAAGRCSGRASRSRVRKAARSPRSGRASAPEWPVGGIAAANGLRSRVRGFESGLGTNCGLGHQRHPMTSFSNYLKACCQVQIPVISFILRTVCSRLEPSGITTSCSMPTGEANL